MRRVPSRGYFGIGVYNPKHEVNIGTLWRSANLFGAAYIFTIGRRYEKQASDTRNTPKHVPLYEYPCFEDFKVNQPLDCTLVGIELTDDAISLAQFCHFERATYLLGAEDHGLPEEVTSQCSKVIQIPMMHSLNVAVMGSIVMYDRNMKREAI